MSRLGQIHDDYLDPDRWLNQAEDYGYDDVLKALKARSTNRWDYDVIDCCLTGKDADLETGDMGLHLDGVDDEFTYATVYAYKCEVGDDVCLNLPDNVSDELFEKAREAYLEQMTEVVIGCGYPGEWSGDDWGFTFVEQIKVATVLTEDGTETDAEKTTNALIAEAERVLAPFEKAMDYMNSIANMLAGHCLNIVERETLYQLNKKHGTYIGPKEKDIQQTKEIK